jgi:predicted acyl esterase
VEVRLFVTADAPSFDVSCVLSRVGADRRSHEIAAGFRRIFEPADGAGVTIPMRATCITLKPGEALRLSIAAASFPAYPMNPGDGSDPTTASRADARIITLIVHHGPLMDSTLRAGRA